MTVIDSILGVWTSLINWFTDSIGSVTEVFYTESGLTFLGGLTILSIALGIATMIVATVRSYLQMRV
jgi:hypothetical protein